MTLTLRELDRHIVHGERINVYSLDMYGELICDSTWDAVNDSEYDYMMALYDFMKEFGDCEVLHVFLDDDKIISAHIAC